MEVDKSFFPLRGKFYNFRLLVSCLKYDGKGLSKSVILGYPTVSLFTATCSYLQRVGPWPGAPQSG